MTRERTGTLVLRAAGCLDLQTAELFRDQVYAMDASSAAGVIIDLSRTTSMDVAGLAALVSVLIRSRAVGRSVALAGPLAPDVERWLDLSGFSAEFGRLAPA